MIPAAPIQGGYILLARKLLKSGIMEKPQLYIKVWIWMLMQASFKDHGKLKRGQFFTSYRRMCDAMAYKAGYRTVKPTIDEIRGVTKFLTKQLMITTTKATHGMVITILNYDFYQCFQNYESHNEPQDDSHNDPTILRKKGIKKEKTPDFSALKKRYADPELIDSVFRAISSTRKSGRVAESILIAQLQKWERYPVEQVEAGIKIYLDKNCADEGKGEKYLMGIICKNKSWQNVNKCTTPEWL